jgi:hypothetical protein
MDLNKKLIDQLSDLSRNIKSLTSEVKENKNAVSSGSANGQKEGTKEEKKVESVEEQNKNFLKSLEDIFKKGIGQITKSNTESAGLLKDVSGAIKGKGLESALGSSPLKDVTSNIKIPKGVSGLLGKLPKFASGGVMDKTGLALVGEKGPEVVKLDKGDKVIPNDRYEEILKMSLEERQKVDPSEYLKATKYEEDKKKSKIKTVDQTLTPQRGPTSDQIEKYKRYILGLYPDHYKEHPEYVADDIDHWIGTVKYQYPSAIDSLLEGKGEEEQTFTQEDVAKLSQPVNKTPDLQKEPEEISKRDQRKKEKEEKRKAKEENKKAEDLLKPEIKEQEGEKSSLMDKGKSFLKEKGIGEKGKNLLFTKGKDILTGKTSLKDIAKNPSSLLGDKSQLLGKGMGAATSLLSNKGLREKATDKLKGLKKEEEKPTMSSETPELKKIQPKEVKSEEVNTTPKKEETPKEKTPEKKENIKSEVSSPEKSGSTNTTKESSGGKSESIGVTDLDEIKSLLGKMVSLLEGPLSIETMESPFRPDSRRF